MKRFCYNCKLSIHVCGLYYCEVYSYKQVDPYNKCEGHNGGGK